MIPNTPDDAVVAYGRYLCVTSRLTASWSASGKDPGEGFADELFAKLP